MTYTHCYSEWKKIKKKTLNIATHWKTRNNENKKSNNHLNLNKHRLIKLFLYCENSIWGSWWECCLLQRLCGQYTEVLGRRRWYKQLPGWCIIRLKSLRSVLSMISSILKAVCVMPRRRAFRDIIRYYSKTDYDGMGMCCEKKTLDGWRNVYGVWSGGCQAKR